MDDHLSNFQIVIIDDDYLTTLVHNKKLVQHRMLCSKPIIFTDPREALTYFLDCPTSLVTYIILLDIDMPHLNGIRFLEELKRIKSFETLNFFIFILSSSICSRVKKNLDGYSQVKGYYNKPFSDDNCNDLKMKISACQKVQEKA